MCASTVFYRKDTELIDMPRSDYSVSEKRDFSTDHRLIAAIAACKLSKMCNLSNRMKSNAEWPNLYPAVSILRLNNY